MRRIHRDVVGAFIFSNDGYLLLGKSAKGGVYPDTWLVPGGGIEPGETRIEALIRETMEEVGIDISNFDIKVLTKELTGESQKTLRDTGEKVLVDMNFYNFIVQANKPASDIKIICKDDIKLAKWHSLKDIPKLNLSPPSDIFLKHMGLK